MVREYSKRPKKKAARKPVPVKRRGSSSKPFAWLMMGLLMGLIVGAVAFFKTSFFPSSGAVDPPIQAEAKPKAKPTPQKTVAKTPAPPKFDFYTLLPEMEVAVTEPPKPAPVIKPVQDEPVLPHPLDQVKYRLQIASFKHYEEADTLKAKLAMSGHVVEIHSIKLDNGSTWYRVYTPIMPTREQAINLQKELQNQAISSMLLKAT